MRFQIVTNKIDNGFATTIPFEMRESFKAAFKSAKYDPDRKRWMTGPRSGKKLEAWKMAAEETLAAVQAAADAEDEILDLTAAIDEIKKADAAAAAKIVELKVKIEALASERSRLSEVEAATARKNQDIVSLSATIAEQRRAADTERAALTDRLSEILDLREVAAATAKMRQNHFPRGRPQFEAGLAVIKNARRRLAEAGLRSGALDYLIDINFNRPDRDRVEHAGDVVTRIYEIEVGEDD